MTNINKFLLLAFCKLLSLLLTKFIKKHSYQDLIRETGNLMVHNFGGKYENATEKCKTRF